MNNFHKFQNFRQFSNLFSQIWLKIDRPHSFLEFGAKSGKKFIKNSQKNAKIDAENEKIRKFNIQSRKNVGDFWLKFWVWRTVQRSALCRSRRELSNQYLLAKFLNAIQIFVRLAQTQSFWSDGFRYVHRAVCPWFRISSRKQWESFGSRASKFCCRCRKVLQAKLLMRGFHGLLKFANARNSLFHYQNSNLRVTFNADHLE